MYGLAKIDIKDLKKVKIIDQEEIIQRTGSPLDLSAGYELIRKETGDFTKENREAKEADALFIELLEKRKATMPVDKGDPNRLRLQAQAKALELLELELELAA